SNQEAPSKWRIVGTYLCQQGFLKRLEQTPKEHYQLETALADAAKNSRVESVALAQGEVTLKYPWDLFSLKDGLLDTWENPEVQARYIAPTAVIRGNVIIEPGVEIHDYAIVEGPAYLGENSLVGQFCIVRKGTVLEEGAHIERYCDVKNSLIGAH